jgi:surfactin synthase thioesterase subunit
VKFSRLNFKKSLVLNYLFLDNVFRSLQVQGFLDDRVPLIFFGHSLGGLIAYELTKFIERELGTYKVAHLIVSGTNSPWDHHVRYTAPSYECKYTLKDDDLLAEIFKLGGILGMQFSNQMFCHITVDRNGWGCP